MFKRFLLISIFLLQVSCVWAASDNTQSTARGQWTEEQAWQWNEKTGVIKGFNEPKLGTPDMSMDDVLRKASELGFNSVRLWLHARTPREQSEFLRDILDKAGAAGLTVSPVLKVREYYLRANTEESKRRARAYVMSIIGEFRDDERIALWDVWNEPGLFNLEREDEELEWTKYAIEWAREAGPSQPITASVYWRVSGDKKYAEVEAMTDVHNFHLYDLSNNRMADGEAMLACLKKISNRPIVCTEAVARSRGGTFGRTLSLFSKYHVHWYSWGLYAGDTNWNVAWERSAFDSFEPWFHDVLHPDGMPYDRRDLDLIRNFHFAGAGETADPGAEITERWNKWRSWKWMATGPVRGWNYAPADSQPWKDMWLSEPEAQAKWAEKIQQAQSAGCNYVRVYLSYPAWKDNQARFYANLDKFLALASERFMGVMPVLLTDKDAAAAESEPVEYVSAVVRKYGFDSRVNCWELYNRPGAGGAGEEKARSLLRAVFEAARFEFPNQPLTATPAVRVRPIAPDFDYRGAFVHGREAGWNRLGYEGGCDLSLCSYVWELSDVISFPGSREMPETGWLLSVANRYGRPVFCTEFAEREDSSAADILDLFSKHHVFWYKQGEAPESKAFGQFRFVQTVTRRDGAGQP